MPADYSRRESNSLLISRSTCTDTQAIIYSDVSVDAVWFFILHYFTHSFLPVSLNYTTFIISDGNIFLFNFRLFRSSILPSVSLKTITALPEVYTQFDCGFQFPLKISTSPFISFVIFINLLHIASFLFRVWLDKTERVFISHDLDRNVYAGDNCFKPEY